MAIEVMEKYIPASNVEAVLAIKIETIATETAPQNRHIEIDTNSTSFFDAIALTISGCWAYSGSMSVKGMSSGSHVSCRDYQQIEYGPSYSFL